MFTLILADTNRNNPLFLQPVFTLTDLRRQFPPAANRNVFTFRMKLTSLSSSDWKYDGIFPTMSERLLNVIRITSCGVTHKSRFLRLV